MALAASRSSGRLSCTGRCAQRAVSRLPARPRSLGPLRAAVEAETVTAVKVLTDEAEWQAAIAASKERGDLVVVDYYTQWCGPCKIIAPQVESMAKEMEHKKVRVYKIDCGATNENKKMAMGLKIKVLPTFRMYAGGSTDHVCEMTGAKPEKLQELIEAQLTELK